MFFPFPLKWIDPYFMKMLTSVNLFPNKRVFIVTVIIVEIGNKLTKLRERSIKVEIML